jgi:ArsR family transcriptional regulator
MKDGAAETTPSPVFDRAAEMFGVLSTPIRLRIIGALCGGEKNVSHLLDEIEVSQPNMSKHLNVLYRTGVVAKRRSGVQVFYRIADESVVLVCKAVCSQIELDVKKGRRG